VSKSNGPTILLRNTGLFELSELIWIRSKTNNGRNVCPIVLFLLAIVLFVLLRILITPYVSSNSSYFEISKNMNVPSTSKRGYTILLIRILNNQTVSSGHVIKRAYELSVRLWHSEVRLYYNYLTCTSIPLTLIFYCLSVLFCRFSLTVYCCWVKVILRILFTPFCIFKLFLLSTNIHLTLMLYSNVCMCYIVILSYNIKIIWWCSNNHWPWCLCVLLCRLSVTIYCCFS
jgi:hypothetical protein